MKFKVNIHKIYIKVQKDPTEQWIKLPFVAIDDVIFNILEAWLLEWHAPEIAEIKKSVA